MRFWKTLKKTDLTESPSIVFLLFQNWISFLNAKNSKTEWTMEITKVTKVTDVSFDYENKVLGLIPRVKVDDKKEYLNSGTKEFDRLAFRYLGMVFFPLAFGYCIYSVIYNEHKSWYSFVLGSCYGFLLTFGFIMMTPQLFINYKLKSVAHLPWRMMTYKALNTFIDDIFAFVIKMPTMYRLGCFRDDIVFFIFLYQRYIYKEDPTRVNEFGFSAEMLEKKDTPVEVEGADETPALELQPDNVEEESRDPDASEDTPESSTGAWKNQKQKSKKAKKVD